ncbi:hypothetical protein Nham_3316 [Nitrobacter hamburgensis X14]|uniref:Uncharacterized protein n=2 Tax=Nitrobacter hamburgensis TaxID=912 RepID=Q1QI99_NITHX|nr:hypothetical protein Nham_3316 [Nitrobacter hamburgensis X14]
MVDLFWSVATSYAVLSIVGIVLAAALVVGHLPLIGRIPAVAPYVVAARLLAYPMLALLAFLIGVRITDERADLKQAQRDLAFSQLQLDAQKQSTEAAQRLRAEAEAKADQANQKVSDYEKRLAKQPAGDGCNLDDADVRSLRDIAR